MIKPAAAAVELQTHREDSGEFQRGTAAAELRTPEEDSDDARRGPTVPKSLGSRSPARDNSNIPCRKHKRVWCAECLYWPVSAHRCQAAAMIAICQDCGKHHPVIADACHLQDTSCKMPASKGTVEGKPATVLRDTGCSSVVVRRSLVPDDKLTGQEALCILIDGTIRHTPVAEILVDTPYYRGPTTAVFMLNPIYDLIVGNVKGATEPNPSRHLTGAMSVTILEGPDSADNQENQLTAAAIVQPEEDHVDQGPELEMTNSPQKETNEEVDVKPHEVTCHAAREHTHQKLKMRTSEPPILRLPDVTWTLILLVVASLVWIGAVLLQGDFAGEERPIASRQLQPYRFLLCAIRGRDNLGADCLSRNPLDDDPVE